MALNVWSFLNKQGSFEGRSCQLELCNLIKFTRLKSVHSFAIFLLSLKDICSDGITFSLDSIQLLKKVIIFRP